MGRFTCPLPLPAPLELPAPYPILPLPDWGLVWKKRILVTGWWVLSNPYMRPTKMTTLWSGETAEDITIRSTSVSGRTHLDRVFPLKNFKTKKLNWISIRVRSGGQDPEEFPDNELRSVGKDSRTSRKSGRPESTASAANRKSRQLPSQHEVCFYLNHYVVIV